MPFRICSEMDSRKQCVLLLVLLVSGIRAEELTIEEAVRMAVRQNPSIANAAIDVAKVEDRIGALRTRRLPSANVYALGSQFSTRFSFWISKS